MAIAKNTNKFHINIDTIKTIDLIPFFLNTIQDHNYISSRNLSGEYLFYVLKIPSHDPLFNKYRHKLSRMFGELLSRLADLNLAEKYNTKSYRIQNNINSLTNDHLLQHFKQT